MTESLACPHCGQKSLPFDEEPFAALVCGDCGTKFAPAPPALPIANHCPNCKSDSFQAVTPYYPHPTKLMDRVCGKCQTRYRPPRPRSLAIRPILLAMFPFGLGCIFLILWLSEFHHSNQGVVAAVCFAAAAVGFGRGLEYLCRPKRLFQPKSTYIVARPRCKPKPRAPVVSVTEYAVDPETCGSDPQATEGTDDVAALPAVGVGARKVPEWMQRVQKPENPQIRRTVGWILMACGALLFWASVVANLVLIPKLLASSVAAALLLLGKRLSKRTVHDLYAQTYREPILLLRAFVEDSKYQVFGLPTKVGVFNPIPQSESFEMYLERELERRGPLVAIGRPDQKLPPDGAARLWVSHSAWQETVDSILADCRFVVMLLGNMDRAKGLSWEVERLFTSQFPEKILLVMPPVDEDEAKRRWNQYQEHCQGRLPPYEGGELLALFRRDWACDVYRAVPKGNRIRRTMEAYSAAFAWISQRGGI